MNRIKNGLLTAILVLAIAASGIFIPSFLLKNVEDRVLQEETSETQEEILVTEIETERLPLILQAVEEDTLSENVQESGENITKERARTNFLYAIEELLVWNVDSARLENYDIEWTVQDMDCPLLAVPDHPSVNVYRVTFDGRAFGFGDLQAVGVMDARSGLLVSVKLSGALLADSMTRSEKGKFVIDDLLQQTVQTAIVYYGTNTSFQFQEQESETENVVELKSRDGEYKLEIRREERAVSFQLKKINL